MEPRIGPVTERHGLLFVLQEVLDVAHLMVHGDQVVHGDHCALFDPGDTGEIKQNKKKLKFYILPDFICVLLLQVTWIVLIHNLVFFPFWATFYLELALFHLDFKYLP